MIATAREIFGPIWFIGVLYALGNLWIRIPQLVGHRYRPARWKVVPLILGSFVAAVAWPLTLGITSLTRFRSLGCPPGYGRVWMVLGKWLGEAERFELNGEGFGDGHRG